MVPAHKDVKFATPHHIAWGALMVSIATLGEPIYVKDALHPALFAVLPPLAFSANKHITSMALLA